MRYRRLKVCGGTYFITIATFQRQRVLARSKNIYLLRAAFRQVKKNHPFNIDAIVVIPDHIHLMMTLPQADDDYPKRIRLLKTYFSSRYLDGVEIRTDSRIRKKERTVWQRRYWEHLVTDEEDFARHIEYIHYNPVKHGLVKSPKDWAHSSFHTYVRKGIYDRDWGAEPVVFDDEIGSE